MFDFEKLALYRKAKLLNSEVLAFLRQNKHIDHFLKDQLKRASISSVINIAEGSGKFTKADKRNFYTISRGSVYECVSILEIIFEEYDLDRELYQQLYVKYEEVSKMLVGLINSQK